MVISTLEASKIMKYTISILEHLCDVKFFFVNRRASKDVKMTVLGLFPRKIIKRGVVIKGKWGCFLEKSVKLPLPTIRHGRVVRNFQRVPLAKHSISNSTAKSKYSNQKTYNKLQD